MSFNPRSDIVLEVLKAADPAQAQLAAERLEKLGANAPAADFAADLDRASAASSSAPAPALASAAGLADARSALAGAAPDAASRAKVQFEAMLLNSFVGEMLPKNAGSVFGEGTAGDVWRSMLSEQIAQQMAKSGALGLSRRLFATHAIAPHEALGRAGEAAAAAATSANVLSASSAADIVNGAVLDPGRKGE